MPQDTLQSYQILITSCNAAPSGGPFRLRELRVTHWQQCLVTTKWITDLFPLSHGLDFWLLYRLIWLIKTWTRSCDLIYMLGSAAESLEVSQLLVTMSQFLQMLNRKHRCFVLFFTWCEINESEEELR